MYDPEDPPNLRNPALRPAEPLGWRWTCVAFCLLVILAFYALVAITNVPAYPGVDQNGYLFGGRTLLEHGIHGYQPRIPGTTQIDPYAFVGKMWIGVDLGTPNERYYPKYPIGYPALIALAWWVGGQTHGPALVYAINPLAMTLALLFTFLLIREIAGSTLALLATIVLATLPATIALANNPNSHATAMLCVTAAMFFLMSWSRHGQWWRIAPAGFAAGYAVTIRYTEGLLILPLLMAWLTVKRPSDESETPVFNYRGRWRDGIILLAAWSLPVGALVAYNLASFGSLTGYDPTNESTGFRLEYAADNWLTMLEQFASRGLALFFPFAIAGWIALCKWQRRLALILLTWTIPSIVAYTFYYWAPDNANTLGYMRFFLTVIPGLLAAAMAMFAGLMEFGYDESLHVRLRRFWIVIAGALVAVAALLNLGDAVDDLLVTQVRRLSLYNRTQQIEAVAPSGSIIFTSEGDLLHHLQFVGDYTLYGTDIFNARSVEHMGTVDQDDPTPFQPQRQLALYDLLKDKTPVELWAQVREMIAADAKLGLAAYVSEPVRIWRGRRAPFSMQPVVTARGWSHKQVAQWANTTVGDHTPGRGVKRTPRRGDPFVSYRADRDAGQLIRIIPPPPAPPTPPAPAPVPAPPTKKKSP